MQLPLFAAGAPATAPDAAPAAGPPRRGLLLAGQPVDYELRRSRRRSIGLVIDAGGLRVSAPRSVALAQIEAALREKSAWIVRKLAEQHQRRAQQEAARVRWEHGATLPFLGQPLVLAIVPPPAAPAPADDVARPRAAATSRRGRVAWHAWLEGPAGETDAAAAALAPPGAHPVRLRVTQPRGTGEAEVRHAVQSWLRQQALALFDARCAHFARVLQVRLRRLALTSAATRWGSASADGTVRLNWRLVHFPLPVIDYVVAHELAHLREMNHGPAFWALVAHAVPDHAAAREQLRRQVLPPPD